MDKKKLSQLSREDLIELLAQELLETRAKKPGRPKKKRAKVNWKTEKHTCPKCDHTGPIDPDFGTRVVRGVELKQSWCVNCRATTQYTRSPRKYQTPNASETVGGRTRASG